jgi:ribosomal protein L29
MKKHAKAISAIAAKDLPEKAQSLTRDLIVLRRGVKMGDVQNYSQLKLKRRERARLLTRIRAERKES